MRRLWWGSVGGRRGRWRSMEEQTGAHSADVRGRRQHRRATRCMCLLLALGTLAAASAFAPAAQAAIVCVRGDDLWVMNDDGSGQQLLRSAASVGAQALHSRAGGNFVDRLSGHCYAQVMKTVPATEFKQKCLALLERVGPEGIVITKHGKPVARLVPVESESSELMGSLAGKIRPRGDILTTGVRWDAQP